MKLSVFLPTIRTHLLPEFCEFLRASYSGELEIVFAGPFNPFNQKDGLLSGPYSSFKTIESIKTIETFQSPTCAAQEAALACTGDLILHSVDDTLYLPGALDELVESFLRLEQAVSGPHIKNEHIIFNAPYCDSPEGYRELRQNKTIHPDKFKHPEGYWTAANAGYSSLNTIENSWMTTCHFLMRKELFLEFGGFDCQFEYLNHACHDLLYRIYLGVEGVAGFSLNETVSLADWVPNREGDHGPINDAQLFHDHPEFIKKWSTIPPLKIDPENYKGQPEVWSRRFNSGGQKEYKELGYA